MLKKKEKLNDQEKAKIEGIHKKLPELGKMYAIKEEIRDIFESQISSDKAFYQLAN